MNNIYSIFRAAVLAIFVIVVVGFTGLLPSAQAQNSNVKVFAKRVGTPQPPSGVFNIRGDFTMIGNTNMTLQSYTETKTNTENPMIYVDVDGVDATVNSSKSTLVFSQENGADPNCANILYAGLYWSGKSRMGDGFTFDVSNSNLIETSSVANESQLATNGQEIIYSAYELSLERAGSSTNYYTRYTLSGEETPYLFEYTNAVTNPVRYSTNGGATWQIPTGQSHTQNFSSTVKRVTFDPVVIIVGSMTFSINELKGSNATTSLLPSTYTDGGNVLGLTANGIYTVAAQQTLDKRKVKIKGPGAADYTEFTATDANIQYPVGQYDDIYVGYRDITQYVKDHGIGEYAVADLGLREGSDPYSGLFGQWALVVVYENSKMPWRDIALFDGYSHIKTVDNITPEEGIIPISGFNAISTGDVNVKIGIMAAEGDIEYSDFLEIEKGVRTNIWQRLAHPKTTVDNFFNSSIYTPVLDGNGLLVENPRTPNLINNTGIDIAMWHIDNADKSIIGNGQSSTRFKYGTTLETYALYFFAFAVDAYVPDLEVQNQIQTINGISVSGNPNPTVQPGQELTYKLDIRNRGSEAVTGGEIVIAMPYTASFVSSLATINYSPTNANPPVFDPTRGSTGSIVWNIGDIPLSNDPQEILATLTYTLKSTEDCFLLAQENCQAFISVNGLISGAGVTSGREFDRLGFIQGYSKDDVCEGEPIRDPLVIQISGAEAWVAANCKERELFLNFEFCNVSETGIPVSQIRGSFPIGTLFYNNSDPQTAVEYNDTNPFPRDGGTFYAIPPNSSFCTFTFNIVVSIVTTNPDIPSIENLTFCQGAIAPDLNTIVAASELEYTLYFYTQAMGGTATTTVIPSTAEAGARDYWVAQGPSAQCIGPKAKITVTVNPTPDFTVTNPQTDCSGQGVNITLTHSEVEGALFTYWLDENATQALDNSAAIVASGVYYIKATLGDCFVIKPVSVNLAKAPNAGIDGALTLCVGTEITEAMLFAALTNNPDPGGTWSRSGNVHTYSVSGAPSCPDANSAVAVSFVSPPNAGINGNLTVCAGVRPSNELLFAALGGQPKSGGSWTNAGNVYTYTVAAAQCTGVASATVTVSEGSIPNAGLNGILEVCDGTEISNATLFTALGGTPDGGGIWTKLSNSYVYTVSLTAPCSATASATVTLNKISLDAPKAEVIQPNCNLSTGKIIILSSVQGMEYALDSQFGSTGNTFEDLTPGEYLIYARKIGSACMVTAAITIIPQPVCLMTITKKVDVATISSPQTLTYTITVKNKSNSDLSEVELSDVMPNGLAISLGAPSGDAVDAGVLNAGETWIYTVTYQATQADIDAGLTLVNTVKIKTGQTAEQQDSAATTIQRNPRISLIKTVDVNSVSTAGIVLNYTLTVTNTGNVTLSSGNLTDPKTGLTVPSITLAPGEEKIFTTTYTVTLADLLSGQPIINKAEVILIDDAGTPFKAESQASVNVVLNSSINLVKTADVAEVNVVGDTIQYTLTVTNTGTAPLIDVIVTDPLTAFEKKIGLLMSGETKVFNTSYVVTAADFNNLAQIVNIAQVSGTAPRNLEVESTDTASVAVNKPAPSLSQIIANDDDYGVHYVRFGGLIGNILGNDLLNGARPDHSKVDFEFTDLDGIIGLLIDENGELSLIPGVNEVRDYTLKYTLRETAAPDNSDDAIVILRILNDETDLRVTKQALQKKVFEGDLIDYEIVVSNVGNTDATNVVVEDNMPQGVTYQSYVVVTNISGATVTPTISGNNVSFSIPILAAGEAVTIQIRVKAGAQGSVVNTVVVSSSEDDLNELDNTDSDDTEVLAFRIPNVITPNDDGKNDFFEIQGLSKYASNSITIFNRNGDHVLEKKDYSNDWNAPGQVSGTYFYVLRVTDAQGSTIEFKGWIQLINE